MPADEVAANDVESRLRVEQEAGVAAVAATTEIRKRELQRELSRTGATTEDKEVPVELDPATGVDRCCGVRVRVGVRVDAGATTEKVP